MKRCIENQYYGCAEFMLHEFSKGESFMAHSDGIGQWLQFPSTVIAALPENRNAKCEFRLPIDDLMRLARVGRRQPIFELWSIIIGAPPPVPSVHHRNKPHEGELTCLAQAHALFQGLERPFADDDRGQSVLSYVLKPRFFYEYDPNMVSLACKVSVPDGLVFVAHVRPDEPHNEQLTGSVSHWEFAESDPADSWLPVQFSSRYRRRLW